MSWLIIGSKIFGGLAALFLAATIFSSKGRGQNFKASLTSGLLALMLVLGGALSDADNETGARATAERKDRCGGDDLMALQMSTHFVKKRLRSPSTAKFPGASAQGVTVVEMGDCRFQVVSYVDAQNGFGATIRSRYSAMMNYNSETKMWSASDVLVE
ncbi:hypothetical protein [Paracoccus alkenifer]|uniref:Uncharacterized protein n=1 Tax=Paracoccus alkenifer TaxID=65735 RepID=A0A1H6N5Y0_9RHOB|nr:hypothetical protein [Paracoccus alkenifer]SEI10114.1 hypothetical protein SAMN04488075_2870 [Paracoccus alkenifer]